jgi:ribonuclease HI
MTKFYVVWKGKKRGVFGSWDECKASVQGVPGAKFKSFGSKARAEAEFRGETLLPPREIAADGEKFDDTEMALAVDGACSGSSHVGEYRGVLLPSKAEVFRGGPWEHCTNNIMEYLAAIRALKWISNRGIRIPVYTDSRTAIKWVKDPECICKTGCDPPPKSDVADELKRFGMWLRTRTDRVGLVACLRKWDTESFGEIPADFNRK